MSELEIRAGDADALAVDVLAIPLLGDEAEPPAGDAWWARAIRRALERAGSGRGERLLWAAVGEEGRPDLVAVRAPPKGRSGEDVVRRAAGAAARAAREWGAASVGFRVPGGGGDRSWQAAAEGLLLGDWSFDELRDREASGTRTPPSRRVLWHEGRDGPTDAERRGAGRGRILAGAQNATRALVAQPGNIVTPRHLGEHAAELARRHGLRLQAWGPDKLREEGFGGLLAVARGSAEEPRFLILEHEGEGGGPVVLVGKGVTFDSGGISLKPSSGMEAMKYDMAGAAAVLGALRAAAELGLSRRVVGLVPSTENLPSGTALKPGDVIRGESGRSIEVINTDAEGRLILSDALSYACKLEPRAVVDLATLTGGCVVALGHHAIGMMSPSDGLSAALAAAGRASGERAWRLPLWPEYRKQLESEIADLKNAGGRAASPITAGSFLQAFVDDGVEWAHLDIAGTAWAEEASGYQPKGATGVGVRLVLEWLRSDG